MREMILRLVGRALVLKSAARYLEEAAALLRERLRLDALSFFLVDEEAKQVREASGGDVAAGLDDDAPLPRAVVGGFAWRGAGAEIHPRFASQEHAALVPLRIEGRVAGVLLAARAEGPFSDAAVERLEEAAEAVSCGLAAARECEIADAYLRLGDEIMVHALDLVAPEGSGHAMRVAGCASLIASALDVPPSARKVLWRAALYHDAGKVLLAGEEPWEVEERHPARGAELLRIAPDGAEAAFLVAHHHARYDGTGAPLAAARDEMPVEAWVLALAEDVDEHFHEHRGAPRSSRIASFFSQKAPSHHPQAVEALATLVGEGRLDSLYR